ncbi:MAG TPA: hotdog domain-containing protein [Pyrinomonadaceae bacterium]|nr:hotdog domain-containing protein [Pyrinomonadaceae bacterium]
MNTYRDPAIRITLLPRDTNSAGTIFGGVILSYIDMAGAIEAHRHGSICHRRDA